MLFRGFLFYAGFLLFPAVRLAGMPLPSTWAVLPFLSGRDVTADIQVVGRWALAGAVGLFVIAGGNAAFGSGGFREMAFSAMPVFFPLGMLTAQAVLGGRGAEALGKGLLVFLLLNLAVAGLQAGFGFGVEGSGRGYFDAVAAHLLDEPVLVDGMGFRPGGLLVSPIWLGEAAYFVGMALYLRTGRFAYLLLVLAMLGVTVSRSLSVVAVANLVVLAALFKDARIFRHLAAVAGLAALVFFCIWALQDVLAGSELFGARFALNLLNGGDALSVLRETNSWRYRQEMYAWLGSSPEYWVFGGMDPKVISGLPYIDSEVVMRTLQFGVTGLVLFRLPLVGAFWVSRNHRAASMFCVVMLTTTSWLALSNTVMSNVYFVNLLGLLLAFLLADGKMDGNGRRAGG